MSWSIRSFVERNASSEMTVRDLQTFPLRHSSFLRRAVVTCLAIAASFAIRADDGPGIDAICGAVDFRDAACYEITHALEFKRSRAVVHLLRDGLPHCTGWLASCENHIITNEHCVGSQAELDRITFEFEYQRSECGGGSAVPTLQLFGGTLLEVDPALDYALIMPNLAGNDPQSVYGYLQWRTVNPGIDEQIYIPHHPNGDPKQLSIESTHPEDQSGRCEVFSLNEPACSGGPPDIGYYCDTDRGTSGAPLISVQDHKVVSLHHCADCPNRGVPLANIYSDIQASNNPLPACSTCGTLAVPQNLTAAPGGTNSIDLSWDEVGGAPRYRIYRSRDGCDGAFDYLATTPFNSYTDESASGNVDYSYRVSTADDCDGESLLSECATSSTNGPCVDAPSFAGLALAQNTRESTCRIDLEWVAADAFCGGPVRYNVYRSPTSGFTPSAANLLAACVTSTSYADASVADDQFYYYVVRAEDLSAAGSGACGGGVEDGNTLEGSSTVTGPDEILYSHDFETAAGWSLDAVGEWQIAAPSGRGGSADGGRGGPDPSAAFEGLGVLGNDLDGLGTSPGNYEPGIDPPSYAVSDPIDLSSTTEAILRYQRWLGVQRYIKDRATLSAWDGSQWTEVWSNPDVHITDSAWTEEEFDISNIVAGVFDARIRFGLQSSALRDYCGWNVDRLEIYRHGVCTTATVLPAPVPDGRFALGNAATARAMANSMVEITWDVTSCPENSYHLFQGASSNLPEMTYDSAICRLDAGGSDIVDITTPPPGQFTWWLIAAADGSIESHHGYDSRGKRRNARGTTFCALTEQQPAGTCP